MLGLLNYYDKKTSVLSIFLNRKLNFHLHFPQNAFYMDWIILAYGQIIK